MCKTLWMSCASTALNHRALARGPRAQLRIGDRVLTRRKPFVCRQHGRQRRGDPSRGGGADAGCPCTRMPNEMTPSTLHWRHISNSKNGVLPDARRNAMSVTRRMLSAKALINWNLRAESDGWPCHACTCRVCGVRVTARQPLSLSAAFPQVLCRVHRQTLVAAIQSTAMCRYSAAALRVRFRST